MAIQITSYTHYQKRVIPRNEYPHIAKIAWCWEAVAKNKESGAELKADKIQFKNCALLSNLIAKNIQDNEYAPTDETYACEDSQGHIQGLMILWEDTQQIYISHLVTNPIHVRSSVNEKEIGRMRGIGTYLLKLAEEVAFQKGKESISLSPIDSSIPFYLKNGFLFCPLDSDIMRKKVEQTSQKSATVFERQVA